MKHGPLMNKIYIEIRIVGSLWGLSYKIKQTSLNWLMCRMVYD